ncbi:MAG TPA: hypothetical protein VK449_06885, partial [Anaerolineales bacterium]|nr:hypothetical protein [Anaerolineales bacterium]
MAPDGTARAAPPDPAGWTGFSRQLAVVLLVLGVLAFVAFLFHAGTTLAAGFLIAFLLYRPIRWAGGRIRYRLAVAVSHLLLLAGLAWFVVRGLNWLARSAADVQQAITLAQATGRVEQVLSTIQATGAVPVLVQSILKLFESAAQMAGIAFIAIIFSFWLLNDLWHARGSLRGWFQGEEGRQVAQMLHHLDEVWVGYLTAQVIFGT